jgi:RimJ/RimL family protein N-acetyltransferase
MIIAQAGEVVIRQLKESDIPEMAEYANNEKISINLRDAFPHPYTLRDAQFFFDHVRNHPSMKIFAIEFQGRYAGNIGLVPGSDVYRSSAEIGYFIGEPFWNRGIMTQAVNLVTSYAFNDLGLIRVHAGIFEYNRASQRVLEKCGYEKEGVFRCSVIKNGVVYDEIRYARIDPALRPGEQKSD